MRGYRIGISVITGLFLGYLFLMHAGYFRIREVIIKGLKRVKREEILELADLPPDPNIFKLNIKGIRDKIASHPWIRKVEVERRFPNKLFIRITEREPIAMVNLNGLFYVDKGGRIFKRLEEGDDYDYPVITGVSKDDNYLSLMDKIKKGVRFLKLSGDLRDVISEVNVSKEGIILCMVDGTMVNMGDREYKRRINRLKKVLIDLRRRSKRASLIDLDYRDKAIVKISGEGGWGNETQKE